MVLSLVFPSSDMGQSYHVVGSHAIDINIYFFNMPCVTYAYYTMEL